MICRFIGCLCNTLEAWDDRSNLHTVGASIATGAVSEDGARKVAARASSIIHRSRVNTTRAKEVLTVRHRRSTSIVRIAVVVSKGVVLTESVSDTRTLVTSINLGHITSNGYSNEGREEDRNGDFLHDCSARD